VRDQKCNKKGVVTEYNTKREKGLQWELAHCMLIARSRRLKLPWLTGVIGLELIYWERCLANAINLQ